METVVTLILIVGTLGQPCPPGVLSACASTGAVAVERIEFADLRACRSAQRDLEQAAGVLSATCIQLE